MNKAAEFINALFYKDLKALKELSTTLKYQLRTKYKICHNKLKGL